MAALLLALPGTVAMVRPPTAAAQALGTMQVSALVSPAPAAWPTLAAAAELAGADGRGRVDLGLARLQLEGAARDDRRLRIRVDYLRN